jgi:hypothetical protein
MDSESRHLLFHFRKARQQLPVVGPRGFLTTGSLAACDQRGPIQPQPLDVKDSGFGEAGERPVIREHEMLIEVITQRVQETACGVWLPVVALEGIARVAAVD